MRYLQPCFVAVLLVFAGCFGSPANTGNEVPSSLEAKVTTIVEQGIITPKEITIFENGTHFLTSKAGKKYLLKSSIVDLSKFLNKQVSVTGETTEVTATELPVITVFAVDLMESPAEQRQSIFTESDFFFSARLPGNWQRVINAGNEKLLLEYHPENEPPAITVELLSSQSPEGVKAQAKMMSGISVTIGGKQGWRLLASGGETSVFVPLREKRKIVIFHNTPGKNPENERTVFYEMLTSLTWIEPDPASPSPSATVSPGVTGVCGGSARKLCPDGFRCELTSSEEFATGVCVDASIPPSDISDVLSQQATAGTSEIGTMLNVSASPTTTTGAATPIPTRLLDASWKEYRNERFSYSFQVPVSWWWKHIIPEEGPLLSRIEIAPAEVTNENRIASIEIFPGTRSTESETIAQGIISISKPRDDKTYFEISGKAEYANQIRNIANAIFIFPTP